MGAWVKTATSGAKAGTDIKDAAGNVLDNEDIRNIDLSINYSGTNIQIKKGSTQIGSNTASPNAILNAQTTYDELNGTKPPSDANKVIIAAGADGNISVNVNGAGAGNIAAYSSAEKVKLNRLQAGKIPTSDTVLIEDTGGSQTKASAAQTAAASDATTKANSAQTAAASDATTKANAAQTAAASDATTKASAAEAAAKAVEVANRFTVPANSTDGVFSFKIGPGDATAYDVLSSASRTKFSGIESGATAGATWGTNLGSQPADADILNDGNFTGTVNNVAVATVTTGAAAGGTANQDSTSTILGGNVTGTVNSVAVATVTSGAAAGATANQDSTAAIRNGITTFERDVSDIFWTNISGQMSPTATSYAVTITWRNGSGTSLGTTVITIALASVTALAAAVTTSNGASATVSLGAAANTNVLQNTTVTKNGIVCNVRAQIIDGSGWNFK